MNLRRAFVFFSLVALATSLSAGTPWSYSLGVSGVDYTWTDESSGNVIQVQMLGLEIRGAELIELSGFYYGAYLSFALPIFQWEFEPGSDTATSVDSSYDLYTSFGIPFGFRWALPRGRSGAYFGAGPSFQALFDFDDHMRGSGGLFLEFGIESLRSKGVGISFGTRLILAWGSFSTDGYTYTDQPMVTTTALFLGISWTGTRGN